MLKKVMKHEFRAMSKIMLPIFLAELGVAVLSVGLMLFLRPYYAAHPGLYILGFFLMMFTFLLLGAACIAVPVVSAIRFSHGLFGDEGYLSQSLPVSPHTHINGRMLIALLIDFVISAVALAGMAACLLLLMQSAFDMTGTGSMIEEIRQAYAQMGMELGRGQMAFELALSGLLVVSSSIAGILAIYAGIAVGNSFTRGKKGFSVLFVFIFTNAMATVQSIVGFAMSISTLVKEGMAAAGTSQPLTVTFTTTQGSQTVFSAVMLLLSLAMCAVFYWITYRFMTRKLNLQ